MLNANPRDDLPLVSRTPNVPTEQEIKSPSLVMLCTFPTDTPIGTGRANRTVDPLRKQRFLPRGAHNLDHLHAPLCKDAKENFPRDLDYHRNAIQRRRQSSNSQPVSINGDNRCTGSRQAHGCSYYPRPFHQCIRMVDLYGDSPP